MGSRLPANKLALERSKRLPGPGQYKTTDTVGKSQNTSTIDNSNRYSFGREQRFSVPTKKFIEVNPNSYKPLNNLNQDYQSTFRKTANTVFGKNNFSIIDQHFNTKESHLSPAPGHYNRFSDFSGLKYQREGKPN